MFRAALVTTATDRRTQMSIGFLMDNEMWQIHTRVCATQPHKGVKARGPVVGYLSSMHEYNPQHHKNRNKNKQNCCHMLQHR